MPAIVVFSHLRWDFVFQRPQHLLTRLACDARVIYIEEPMRTSGEPRLERIEDASGVIILRPYTQVDAPGFHDAQLPALQSLLAGTFEAEQGAIAWLYTPMALPLVSDLNPSLVVYDCMDELTGFRGAPKQLRQREHALMQQADLVFTGGKSLFEAKRRLHAGVHCFPSSVDATHFRSAGVPSPASTTQAPVLGFFGVLDERFDPTIVAAVADAEPTWRIELIGPIVKIDPASLPKRDNVHYLGMRSYADLPTLIAGWDVCLMPFAINEATRYISPTKILEYMAADKPVVSTPIRDVVDPYASVVFIADGADAFVAACRAALGEPADARRARSAAMRAIVDATSWDLTARQMRQAIADAMRTRSTATDSSFEKSGSVAVDGDRVGVDGAEIVSLAASPRGTPRHVGTAIIGAGPTGLSAGYHMTGDFTIFERGPVVGGWCRSIEDKGFTFDYAGHIMFSNDPAVHALYAVLLGENVHWQNREAWVYSHDVYTRYPFQGALHGLPPEVLKECLVGAIEARFGAIDGTGQATVNPAPADDAASATTASFAQSSREVCLTAPAIAGNDDCCGDGVQARPDTGGGVVTPISNAPRNFEEFIYRTWGAGVAKHFAVPYNRKLWAVPLTSMETSWLGGRVPLPDLAEMIEGAVQPAKKPVGPNARFGYPLRGGFQALMNGFLPHIQDRIELDANVVRLDVERREFGLGDGRQFAYDRLISTMPLPQLVRLIGDAAPAHVRAAAEGLRHVSVRCVNLGIGRADITEKHWIYYPGATVFHRVFVQGNASPHCNPEGGFGLTCEITHNASKPLPCEGQALIQRCFDDCVSVGLLRPDDIIVTAGEVEMDYAYVVYDHARAANVKAIRDWLTVHDIFLAGRYSEWEYYNSDHAFLAGKRIAALVESQIDDRATSTA